MFTILHFWYKKQWWILNFTHLFQYWSSELELCSLKKCYWNHCIEIFDSLFFYFNHFCNYFKRNFITLLPEKCVTMITVLKYLIHWILTLYLPTFSLYPPTLPTFFFCFFHFAPSFIVTRVTIICIMYTLIYKKWVKWVKL